MNSLTKAGALAGALFVGTSYADEQLPSKQNTDAPQQTTAQKAVTLTESGSSATQYYTLEEFDQLLQGNLPKDTEVCTEEDVVEAERKFQEKIVTYNGVDYDLSRFHDKVLEPIHEFLPDFDLNMLMKIAMMENSGYGRKPHEKDYEMKHVLKLFSNDNYYKSMRKVSKAGARGTFQVLPSTEKMLNRFYKIERQLKAKRNILREQYGIESKKDFDIFRNALYGAYQMQFTIDKYLEEQGKTISQAALAVGYNAGPGRISRIDTEAEEINPERLPGETKDYLKKLITLSKHPEVQIPIERKYPLGV